MTVRQTSSCSLFIAIREASRYCRRALQNVYFITGTDTGVGKTTLTTLLLLHLRRRGIHALGMKPFCSGGGRDIRLISAAQDHELSERELNPYRFSKPLAPGACAASKGITLRDVTAAVRRVKRQCDVLLVEGAGGVQVPLTRSFAVIDLIDRLKSPAIIVAANKLGTINHTLLTVDALRARNVETQSVVLMNQKRGDASASTNAKIIGENRRFVRVIRTPYLGADATVFSALKKAEKKIEKTIAQVLEPDTFCASSERRVDRMLRYEAR